jgi:hypothetical protein
VSILGKLNLSTSIIKNIVIIGGISIAAIYLLVSVIANATEDRPGSGPKPPSIEKAGWALDIKTTGQTLYTNKYEQSSDDIYILHGFYAIDGKKYKRFKTDLTIDERYFGEISIHKRSSGRNEE